jgi:hypothetical protein
MKKPQKIILILTLTLFIIGCEHSDYERTFSGILNGSKNEFDKKRICTEAKQKTLIELRERGESICDWNNIEAKNCLVIIDWSYSKKLNTCVYKTNYRNSDNRLYSSYDYNYIDAFTGKIITYIQLATDEETKEKWKSNLNLGQYNFIDSESFSKKSLEIEQELGLSNDKYVMESQEDWLADPSLLN